MISALLLAAVLGQATIDTMPVVTLEEALSAGVASDPDYVRAVGQLDNAEWGRKAAMLVFVLPTVTASADYQELSTSQFNIGIGSAASASGRASLDARYELFSGGRKYYGARQARAELDLAEAGELGARFLAALETERDYYTVLLSSELLEVSRQRVDRAEEQFALARARVAGGATVQSDSLQVLLELQRARIELLTREADLTVARLQLGRRVGSGGPVDAAPLDVDRAPDLELPLDEAVRLAVTQGPAWRMARASERSSEAALKAQRGAYLPSLALTGSISANDNKFFPSATSRQAVGFSISWSIWNGGQRELTMERLRTGRNAARAIREDLERAARRDVTEAWTGYQVRRQALEIADAAVDVATEVLRVQDARYQAGASTVLELLDAQEQLVLAGAAHVEARYGVRLALSQLEAMLGRRLNLATP